jgi:hypothetical protein
VRVPDDAKQNVEVVTNVSLWCTDNPTITPVEGDSTATRNVDDVDEKKLMRKIDGRLLPILFVIYVAAFLDR